MQRMKNCIVVITLYFFVRLLCLTEKEISGTRIYENATNQLWREILERTSLPALQIQSLSSQKIIGIAYNLSRLIPDVAFTAGDSAPNLHSSRMRINLLSEESAFTLLPVFDHTQKWYGYVARNSGNSAYGGKPTSSSSGLLFFTYSATKNGNLIQLRIDRSVPSLGICLRGIERYKCHHDMCFGITPN